MKSHTFFSGKLAVITGGGGVLCTGFARALTAEGASVALLDIDRAAAEECAAVLRDEGCDVKAYRADVLSKESLKAARGQIAADFGRPCDILINGAGGNNPRATTDAEYYFKLEKEGVKTFFDLDKSGIEFVLDLNFMGTLLPTQVFAPEMIGIEGASILNISSMNAFTPLTKIPAYSAAKSAVSNLTQWLAVHFSKCGLRVNAIAPGFFVTKQNEKLLFDADKNPTPRTKKILAATPMERFGRPDELFGALLFLLDSNRASFVTGVVLPVDGGFSAYSGV